MRFDSSVRRVETDRGIVRRGDGGKARSASTCGMPLCESLNAGLTGPAPSATNESSGCGSASTKTGGAQVKMKAADTLVRSRVPSTGVRPQRVDAVSRLLASALPPVEA